MRNNRLISLIPYLIVMLAIFSLLTLNMSPTVEKLTYASYLDLLAKDKITEAKVTVSNVVVNVSGTYLNSKGVAVSYALSVPKTETQTDSLIQAIYNSKATYVVVDANAANPLMDFLSSVVPFILFGVFAFFLLTRMNGGGGQNKAFEFGKSKARLEGNIKVRFDDVAGCDEEKEEMSELIEYLKNPKKFARMGARIPKGVLLVEMDGITDNAGVLIIAATNRPDVLDPALLRPGRFDRQITVSLPDRKGRRAILEVHARNKKLAPDLDLDALAKRTPGFSGADLENVLNEAAILAVRDGAELITMAHLDEAIDRVIMGPAKKSRTYSEKEKRFVAYHESGHTIIGLMCKDSDMVQKVTIIPRGTAGGYNLMTPREEKFVKTKSDLMATITGLLGGRVAEQVVFNEISTGASNDIEKATQIARDMVMQYGMSELGPIQYEHRGGNVFLGRDYAAQANYSGQVAFEIDQEVRRIIDNSYEAAHKLIMENRELMDKIAAALIEFETLTSEQIEDIVQGRPVSEHIKKQVLEPIQV